MNRRLLFMALGTLAVSCLACEDEKNNLGTCTPGCMDEYMLVTCSADGQENMQMCQYGCQNNACITHNTPDPEPDDTSKPDPNGDDDNDNIPNGIETDSCLAYDNDDTDNDGVKDADEDLNRNGSFEPELGETDPCNNKSYDKDDDANVKKLVCKGQEMLSGKTIELEEFTLIPFENAEYRDSDHHVAFRHENLQAVGFYGVSQGFSMDDILQNALPQNKYVTESSYINAIPRKSWLKNNVYDKSLQGLPDHVIDRYKVTIDMEGIQTLEDLQDLIARKLFGPIVVFDKNDKTRCESKTENNRKAILYLSRTAYSGNNGNMYLYSGALTCRDHLTNNFSMPIANIMDDSISGVMAAPKGVSKNQSYKAFDNFVCQAETFSMTSGAVDFLWVIDNSGSMGDELSLLADTVDQVAERLDNSGIDYRFAVTTTDAYLIDEQGIEENKEYSYDVRNDVTYMPYNENYQPNRHAYINGLGIRTTQYTLPCMFGRDHLNVLKNNIKKYSANDNSSACPHNLNICGKGYEDGFKSGALTLERLSLNIDDPKPADISQTWWDSFIQIKKHLAYQHYFDTSLCSENETDMQCTNLLQACQTRPNALKYIIFVSDEDSRQFKEDAIVSPHETHLNGCLTGYKLEVTDTGDMYSMMTGVYAEGKNCNPSLKDYKERLSEWLKNNNSTSTLENMSLVEIKAAYPEYYDMLSYYMEQYRKYGGTQSVAAFALVGDAGSKNGTGFCRPLATCSETDCTKYSDNVCIKCGENDDKWNYHDAQATDGADFGLSYIHLARFLSTVYRDENGIIRTDGKEGGYASICNNDYDISVDSIFTDLTSRISPITLKGYPIPTTIHVAIIQNGKAVEIKRDTGWRYDAIENAVILNDIKNVSDNAKLAVSYNIWTFAK
ncbi:MAG: VWA domain-containing protein [Proteobacteria bacterium]|nr:VWA domain-containing protein [Pseudomonadota bacterium]